MTSRISVWPVGWREAQYFLLLVLKVCVRDVVAALMCWAKTEGQQIRWMILKTRPEEFLAVPPLPFSYRMGLCWAAFCVTLRYIESPCSTIEYSIHAVLGCCSMVEKPTKSYESSLVEGLQTMVLFPPFCGSINLPIHQNLWQSALPCRISANITRYVPVEYNWDIPLIFSNVAYERECKVGLFRVKDCQ